MSVLNPPTHAPRLLLDTTGARNTLLDGGWWPRSTDPVAELPELVLAIDGLHEPVSRLILHAGEWAEQPTKLRVAGRIVKIGYFASQPLGLLTAICGRLNRVDLLVVPPDTEPAEADAAMKLSTSAGNQVHAQDILAQLRK
jgi:hypothetical protein